MKTKLELIKNKNVTKINEKKNLLKLTKKNYVNIL